MYIDVQFQLLENTNLQPQVERALWDSGEQIRDWAHPETHHLMMETLAFAVDDDIFIDRGQQLTAFSTRHLRKTIGSHRIQVKAAPVGQMHGSGDVLP